MSNAEISKSADTPFQLIIEKAVGLIFPQLIAKSEANRIREHKKFRSYYDYDKDEIESDIRVELITRKIFEKATANKLLFGHLNIIRKALNRIVGGIYANEPVRYLKTGEKDVEIKGKKYKQSTYDPTFSRLLKKSKYHKKIKELLKKTWFFRIALIMPAYRNGKFYNDIYTPDEFIALPKANDYLELEALIIQKFDAVKNEFYFTYWSETQHFNIDMTGNRIPISGNEKNKNPLNNPLGRIPAAIARVGEGKTFYGVPNWPLLESQRQLCIKMSGFTRTELNQMFSILVGINTNLADNTSIEPGKFLQLQGDDMDANGKKNIDVKYVSPPADILVAQAKNIDWFIERVLNAESVPASSASRGADAPKQVGAKTIDEIEIQEVKEDIKLDFYDTELEAMENLVSLYNYYQSVGIKPKDKLLNKKIEDGEIEVNYSDEKLHEDVESKIKRRDHEKQMGISDEIDFIQEDKEISESEAVDHFEERMSRIKSLGGNTQSQVNQAGDVQNQTTTPPADANKTENQNQNKSNQ